jgi:hypothetical protein
MRQKSNNMKNLNNNNNMKNLISKHSKLLKTLFGAIICAGIIVIAVMCAAEGAEEEDCKTCTNLDNKTVQELCGSELKEAQRGDSKWTCK